MSRPKIEFWSGIEEDIVRTSGNRAEAYRQLRLEGFKRTENATWAKYRKLKRKHMNINLYTKSNCPNCLSAKQLLASKNLPFVEIDVELGSRWQNLLAEFPDARQMPQIFINDQRVGGLAGLQAALKQIEERNDSSRH